MREWIRRAPRGRSPRQGRRARWSLVQRTTCSTCSCTCWLYNTPWSTSHPWEAWQDRDRPGVGHRSPAETDSARFRFPRTNKNPFWLPGETCEFPQVGGDLPKAAVAIATGRRLVSSDFVHLCLQCDVGIWQLGVFCMSDSDCFLLCFVSLNMEAAEFTRATAEEETTWTLGLWRSSRPPWFWRGNLDSYCISAFCCFQYVATTNIYTFM